MTRRARLIVFLAATTALTNRNPLAAQTEAGRVAATRLQRDRWVDSFLRIDHPLYEIVKVGGSSSLATAAFIPNCRLLTTLRDLVITRAARPGAVNFHDIDFVGERFEFQTKPLPALGGKPATGHFVVMATGQLNDPVTRRNNGENWAIGYDQECLSDKLRLGHVLVGHAHTNDSVLGWEFMTASYERGVSPDSPSVLVIDPKCRGIEEVRENRALMLDAFRRNGWLLTDCMASTSGLGQMLLRPLLQDGQPLLGAWGRPYLVAYGLVVARESPDATDKPSTRAMVFSDVVRDKFRPYLDGPVAAGIRRP